MVTVDKDSLICFWNSAANNLFGHARREIIGKPVSSLMPECFRERHQASMKDFTAGGVGKNIGRALELTGRRKDGSEFPLELTLGVWHFHILQLLCYYRNINIYY